MYHIFTGVTCTRIMRQAVLCLLLSLVVTRAWPQAAPCDAARIVTSGSTCSGCKVLNTTYAADDNIISASTLVAAPGSATTYVQQVFQFAANSNAGDSAYIFLSFPAAITDPQVLQSIQLSSYLNSTYNDDRKPLRPDSFRIQWYTPEQALVSWAPAHMYNRVGIRLTAGASTAVNIHYASSGISKPHVLQDSIGVCAGMAVNLQAAGSPGTVINWYAQPYGGCPLYTGNTFTTPPLSSPTTYYAEAAKGSCANTQRLPVTVYINPGVSELSTLWNKTFGGTGADILMKILPAGDGNYLLAGYGTSDDGDLSGGSSDGNYWLMKITPDGAKIWSKTYGGSKLDYLTTMVPAGNGAYLLGGRSASSDGDVTSGNKGGEDVWIIKVDTNGNKLWDKSFGGFNSESLGDILPTADGGYLLAGSSSSSDGDISDGNKGSADGWIVKLDANGNKLWDKSFGGSSYDVLMSALPTADGGYLLGGQTQSNNGDVSNGPSGNSNYWVIKTDINGNKQWDKTYGGSKRENFHALAADGAGGYLLVGETESNNGDVRGDMRGGQDIWVLRIDASGNKVWNRTYGGNANDFVNTIIPAGDGNFLLGGQTLSDNLDVTDGNNGSTDWWLLKIDMQQQGIIQWDKTWGGAQSETIYGLHLMPNGGLLAAGVTNSNNGDVTGVNRGAADGWLIKAQLPNCGTSLRRAAIATDTVARSSAIKAAGLEQPVLTAYPNPFSQQLSLRYSLQKAGHISLQLYNMQGQPVRNLKDATLEPGVYTELINGSGLESGTYICRMLLDGKRYSQTVIKL